MYFRYEKNCIIYNIKMVVQIFVIVISDVKITMFSNGKLSF